MMGHVHFLGETVPVNLNDLYAWGSAVTYALSYIFVKKGQLSKKGADDDALLPVLFVSACVLLAGLLTDGNGGDDSERPDFWFHGVVFCGLAGVSGTFLGRLALYGSMDRIGASRAVAIKNMSPIATVVISSLFLGETFHWTDILGMGFVAAGVFFLVWDTEVSEENRSLLKIARHGFALAAYSAMFHAIGHVFRKFGIGHVSSAVVSAFIDVLAAFFLYAAFLWKTGKLKRTLRSGALWNPHYVLGGIFSAAAILFFFLAAHGMQVSHVSVIVGTEPLITLLFGIWFLGDTEKLNLAVAFGALFIVMGALLVR
jgi:drug/metabolite transporter (DMT)-like permease